MSSNQKIIQITWIHSGHHQTSPKRSSGHQVITLPYPRSSIWSSLRSSGHLGHPQEGHQVIRSSLRRTQEGHQVIRSSLRRTQEMAQVIRSSLVMPSFCDAGALISNPGWAYGWHYKQDQTLKFWKVTRHFVHTQLYHAQNCMLKVEKFQEFNIFPSKCWKFKNSKTFSESFPESARAIWSLYTIENLMLS